MGAMANVYWDAYLCIIKAGCLKSETIGYYRFFLKSYSIDKYFLEITNNQNFSMPKNLGT